jgi:dipeptidyl aminopeptidase/acylaminoacyl peptidase
MTFGARAWSSSLQGERYDAFAQARVVIDDLLLAGAVDPVWEDAGSFTFIDRGGSRPTKYRVDCHTGSKTPIEADAAELAAGPVHPLVSFGSSFGGGIASPDGDLTVNVKVHDLELTYATDGRTEMLTATGSDTHRWSPMRALPGAGLNVTWSPNGRRLVATATDSEGVNRSPVVRWLKAHEEVEWQIMPRPGEKVPTTTLYVIDTVSKSAVPLEGSGLEDHTYYPVGWEPEGCRYLFLRMDRRMQQLDLIAADARTGVSSVLITETSETFIAGLDFIMRYTRYVRVTREHIVWLSERDGFDHLYLYSRDGKLLRRLTAGSFCVGQVLRIDEQRGWVYFAAHSDISRPYDVHVCRVSLDGTNQQQLTDGEGVHCGVNPLFDDGVCTTSFSPDDQHFVTTFSSPSVPPETQLRRADGVKVATLTRLDISALEGAGWTPPTEFTVKAADGETDLYGVIQYPLRFDASRSYPVLDHIYNGPFVSWVPHTFNKALSNQGQIMATADFVVVTVDGRGTTHRGKAFQDVVYMNWGRNEIPDHEAAIREVASTRPFMNLERVGLFGGSWGGYMTQRGMLLAPDFYKVGVSTAPVADLYDHTLNLEWYVGLPQDNRDVYDFASNILRVDQLKGRLLLVHGTLDLDNAPFSSTMKLANALVKAGKQFDLMVVPEMGHGASTPEHIAFFLDLQYRYFVEHLG